MLSFSQMENPGGFLLIGIMIDNVSAVSLIPSCYFHGWEQVQGASYRNDINPSARKLSSPLIFLWLLLPHQLFTFCSRFLGRLTALTLTTSHAGEFMLVFHY